jgi:hypothetical protein
MHLDVQCGSVGEATKMTAAAWIALGGVIGTWFIFSAAIWGERIRSWLFKPQLRLDLISPRGEHLTETITTIDPNADSPLRSYTRPARRYLVSVTNTNRWPIAHNVQIVIERLEREGPDGSPTPAWTGEIPLQWVDREIHPLLRTIGRPARAALAVVTDDSTRGRKELHLMPLIEPSNFQRSYYARTHLWVTLMATADEADSQEVRLEIAWDGQWNDGDSEMAQHLTIRQA